MANRNRKSPTNVGIKTNQRHKQSSPKPVIEMGSSSSELEWVPVIRMSVDPAYQRPAKKSLIEYIAKNFDVDALGALYVSQRSSGAYVVLDGQQRLEAIKLMGWVDQSVPCRVWTGLTLAQEAWLFVQFNTKRVAVMPVDVFKAKLESNDPQAEAINSVLKGFHFKVANGNTPGNIQAISAVERVFVAGGEKLLHETLSVLHNAYAKDPAAYVSNMITGTAALIHKYKDQVDHDRLVHRLSREVPSSIHAKAKTLRGMKGGSIMVATMEVMVGVYNRGGKGTLGKDNRPDDF